MRILILPFFACAILFLKPHVQGQGKKGQEIWKVVSANIDGKNMDGINGKEFFVAICGEKVSIFRFLGKKLEMEYSLKVDKNSNPWAVDLIDSEGFTCKGIYEQKGDTLRICLVQAYRRQPNQARPTTFDTREQPTVLYVLQRIEGK